MRANHGGPVLVLELLGAFGLITISSTERSEAKVNMWSGGYENTWNDFGSSGGQSAALTQKLIERRYDSRSLRDGIFGFGWCVDIEARLVPLPDGGWRRKSCQGEADYRTSGTGSWIHEASGLMLRSKGTTQSIQFKANDGTTETYDSSGRLLEIRTPGGEVVRLGRNHDGLIEKITSTLGASELTSVEFVYDLSTRKVARMNRITSARQRRATLYEYRDGNLVKVTDEKAFLFTYSYDSYHNMLRAESPDSTSESITYEDSKDRVVKMRSRDGCAETYRYETDSKDAHLISTAEKSCGGTSVAISKHEFWHESGEDGRARIIQARVSQGERTLNARFTRKPDRSYASERQRRH